jgi:uncharacterized tellurite resistance protein B-like protein
MRERIEAVCDLLLAAAFADEQFVDSEKEAITTMLCELAGTDELDPGLAARIEHAENGEIDAMDAASVFVGESDENKKTLLKLVSAVHDADDEYDFAEDEFMILVTGAIGLNSKEMRDYLLDYEVEDLAEYYKKLTTPPPVPQD